MNVTQRTLDEWRASFVTQARVHDLPGARIEEALAEIETHCDDSGQHPLEAFGDPASYAAALARGLGLAGSGSVRRRLWRSGRRAAGTLTGLLLLGVGLQALRDGHGSINLSQLIVVVVTAGLAVMVVAARLGLWRRRYTWALIAAAAVSLTLMGLDLLLGTEMLFGETGFGGGNVFSETSWGLFAMALFVLVLTWWPSVWSRPLTRRTPGSHTGTLAPWWLIAIRWIPPAILLWVAIYLVTLPKETLPG